MKMPSGRLLVTTILMLTAAFWLLLGGFRISKVQPRTITANPDHFYLSATKSALEYHFIYDPLAADNWLRESCGLQTNLPLGKPDER